MVGSATILTRSVSEAINPGTSLTLRVNMARHWSWRWGHPYSERPAGLLGRPPHGWGPALCPQRRLWVAPNVTRRGMTVKEKAYFVFKHRYLIVKRQEDFTEQE